MTNPAVIPNQKKSVLLTPKQRIFVAGWTGDVRETSKATGLSVNTCYSMAKKKHVLKAINARIRNKVNLATASRVKRQRFWSDAMNDDSLSMKDRLKASELLGRSEADFTEKVLTGTLEDELKNMTEEELDRRLKEAEREATEAGSIH